MSRTKRENCVDVNVVLMINKSHVFFTGDIFFFLPYDNLKKAPCLSSSKDETGVIYILFFYLSPNPQKNT